MLFLSKFIISTNMQQPEWSTLGPQICQLARAAGNAILRIYQDSADTSALVAHKSDDSPLTLADLAAHQVLAEGLARLTPQIPVVSEEDAGSFVHRTAPGCFWLIDPLDGTKEFLARNGEFTVNIALVEGARPVLGVVQFSEEMRRPSDGVGLPGPGTVLHEVLRPGAVGQHRRLQLAGVQA